jgi:hypothetical protein
MVTHADNRVLALGVYLLDTPNYAARISGALTQSKNWRVELRWAAVGSSRVPEDLRTSTFKTTKSRESKFHLLNELVNLDDMSQYRYLVVTDDDIEIADGFLDAYLSITERFDLMLAQPARTHDSYIDHQFVAQLLGVQARSTRFVEIGPLFSLRQDIFSLLLPFDEDAPMGWGLDFVWPVQLEQQGTRLGIVDATPVKHALRKPVALYDYESVNNQMHAFLAAHAHLERREAFIALETYPPMESPKQSADRKD